MLITLKIPNRMKSQLKIYPSILLALFLLCFFEGNSQNSSESNIQKSDEMKTYVIERNIADVGNTPMNDLIGISQKSCGVLEKMGADNIQWLHSYVAEDKIYCVYKAYNKDAIKEHAEKGGFPANSIMEVSNVINPATAKQKPN